MTEQPVIFFDGICNLCNASVQFVIEYDKKKLFRFSSLQSEYAAFVLPKFDVDITSMNSILLLDNGRLYTKSSCVLHIARQLSGIWPLLYVFIVIPKFIRDWVYDIISKNRYKWFGKQESCWVPTPELKNRFYS